MRAMIVTALPYVAAFLGLMGVFVIAEKLHSILERLEEIASLLRLRRE